MRGLELEKRASIGAVTGPIGLFLGLVAVVIAINSPADAAGHHGPHKITAKQLAPGAVTEKAIRKGAVGKKALGEGVVTNAALADNAVNARTLSEGSVTGRAIAPAAVTHGAIAPGSVSSSTLTGETIHVTPIADHDAVASNPEWTPSNTEVALCGPGEDLLGTGFMFTEPGNHEVSFLRAQPSLGATGNGVAGEISSNSGGTAKAQIMAICLGS
jgi:hypothetical protein